MMQAIAVGAADIHARPAPHRLQPFQHLDRGRVVFAFSRRSGARRGFALGGRNFTGRRCAAKQVVGHAGFGSDSFGPSLAQPRRERKGNKWPQRSDVRSVARWRWTEARGQYVGLAGEASGPEQPDGPGLGASNGSTLFASFSKEVWL